MITEQILHDKLCEKLTGSVLNRFSLPFQISCVIDELLAEENFIKPECMSYNNDHQTITFYLSAKDNRFSLFEIKVKKKMNIAQYGRGYEYANYVVKDFEIDLRGAGSVEEAIQIGENKVSEYIKSQNSRYAELEEKVRNIQTALGLETPGQALRICEEIARNSYRLFS